jgi:hypothetical protein
MFGSVAEFVVLAHAVILTALPFGYCLNSYPSTMFLPWSAMWQNTLNGGGITHKHT